MSKMAVLLPVVLITICYSPVSANILDMECKSGNCSVGQFFDNNSGKCQRCPGGHFMDRKNHSCGDCFECTEPGDGQGIKSSCTPEKDNELYCTKNDYFLAGPSGVPYAQHCKLCQKCSQGFYMVSPCSETKDTVCSPLPPATGQSPVLETTWQPLSGTPSFSSATPQLPNGSNISTPAAPVEVPSSSLSPGVIAAIVIVPVVVLVLSAGVYFLYGYLKSKYAKCPQQEDRGKNC